LSDVQLTFRWLLLHHFKLGKAGNNMKKYLLSTLFVFSALTFSAQATNVATISDFTQGDVFTASGLANSLSIDLITKPGSTATASLVPGQSTGGSFVHEYLFSPITSLVIALSSGSTNTGVGGIVGLVLSVTELGGGTTSISVPLGGSASLPLTMTAGNNYVVQLDNGANNNTTGGYLLGVSNVPVPAAVWLFGSALLGLFGFKKASKSRGLVATA
jgi:hypothetical protein